MSSYLLHFLKQHYNVFSYSLTFSYLHIYCTNMSFYMYVFMDLFDMFYWQINSLTYLLIKLPFCIFLHLPIFFAYFIEYVSGLKLSATFRRGYVLCENITAPFLFYYDCNVSKKWVSNSITWKHFLFLQPLFVKLISGNASYFFFDSLVLLMQLIIIRRLQRSLTDPDMSMTSIKD